MFYVGKRSRAPVPKCSSSERLSTAIVAFISTPELSLFCGSVSHENKGTKRKRKRMSQVPQLGLVLLTLLGRIHLLKVAVLAAGVVVVGGQAAGALGHQRDGLTRGRSAVHALPLWVVPRASLGDQRAEVARARAKPLDLEPAAVLSGMRVGAAVSAPAAPLLAGLPLLLLPLPLLLRVV